MVWPTFKHHSSTFNFWPLISLWGHFQAPYFKMLNDARVASACSYVRACQSETAKKKKKCNSTWLPSSRFILLFVNLDYRTKLEMKTYRPIFWNFLWQHLFLIVFPKFSTFCLHLCRQQNWWSKDLSEQPTLSHNHHGSNYSNCHSHDLIPLSLFFIISKWWRPLPCRMHMYCLGSLPIDIGHIWNYILWFDIPYIQRHHTSTPCSKASKFELQQERHQCYNFWRLWQSNHMLQGDLPTGYLSIDLGKTVLCIMWYNTRTWRNKFCLSSSEHVEINPDWQL